VVSSPYFRFAFRSRFQARSDWVVNKGRGWPFRAGKRARASHDARAMRFVWHISPRVLVLDSLGEVQFSDLCSPEVSPAVISEQKPSDSPQTYPLPSACRTTLRANQMAGPMSPPPVSFTEEISYVFSALT